MSPLPSSASLAAVLGPGRRGCDQGGDLVGGPPAGRTVGDGNALALQEGALLVGRWPLPPGRIGGCESAGTELADLVLAEPLRVLKAQPLGDHATVVPQVAAHPPSPAAGLGFQADHAAVDREHK